MTPDRFSNIRPALSLGLMAALFLCPPASAEAGDYLNSAHGHTSTGVSRKGLNDITLEDYATGNCAHCHEQHASVIGSEPVPNTLAGPATYLGMNQEAASPDENAEQSLCVHCHGLTGSTNNESSGTPDDIDSDISRTNNHDLTISDTAHDTHETLAEIAAAKHIECTDCHNPHAAGKTVHTDGTNLIATNSSPLYGATGAAQSYAAASSNWSQPTQGSYTLQTATKEYEICFKCHTGANSNVTTWGGISAEAWTDVGLEFNPNNKSYHPIVKSLNDGNSSSLTNTYMEAPWTNTGSQTMYCTDCHESSDGDGNPSTLAGPHGSTVKWMLAGTNKAWPYTSSADNGTSDATPDYLYLTSTAGMFCLNCHKPPSGTNAVHIKTKHQTATVGRCLNCHLRVPHGGKLPRLISATTTLTNLPDRYWPDGNGGDTINGSGNQPELEQFTQTPPYNKANCKGRGCADAQHNNTTGESW